MEQNYVVLMDAFENVSKGDHNTIKKIVTRAWDEDAVRNAYSKTIDLFMDLMVTHYYHPIRLQHLLESSDFNFLHDVLGIAKHLDRKTGMLKDCFSPRFSL